MSSDDLLDLFDADFGILTIRTETRILGRLEPLQEALAMLEYLRMRKITSVISSQDIRGDFPDLQYPPGFSIIAGLLLVPLNIAGDDFYSFVSPQPYSGSQGVCFPPDLISPSKLARPYFSRTVC